MQFIFLIQFEAKNILENLNTKIKQIDEFEHFKSSICELKHKSQDKFFNLVGCLPENKQAYFKEILSSHRIVLNPERSEKTIVRKIVKTKKTKRQINE